MLLAVTAATGFIDWAPTRFLPEPAPWRWLQMPTWLDEQYTWMSVVTLVGFAWILYDFGFVARGAGRRRRGAKALLAAAGGAPRRSAARRAGEGSRTQQRRPAAAPGSAARAGRQA